MDNRTDMSRMVDLFTNLQKYHNLFRGIQIVVIVNFDCLVIV